MLIRPIDFLRFRQKLTQSKQQNFNLHYKSRGGTGHLYIQKDSRCSVREYIRDFLSAGNRESWD